MKNTKTICNVLLDSGAFSAWRRGSEIPLKDYIAYCKRHEHEVDAYVNLDTIPGEAGKMDHSQSAIERSAAKSYETLQVMKDAGLKPIPVFHQGERFYWLDRMLEEGETYVGISPYLRSHQNEIIEWMDKCFTRITDRDGRPLIKTHGFGVTASALCVRYPWHCLTPDHDVLTRRGWKPYTELGVGDLVLCFDLGVAKWQPIQEIPVFDVVDAETTKFSSRTFSAHVSQNHRWIVQHQTKKTWRWKTTETLTTDDLIPRVANQYEGPVQTIPNYIVELMGWFWTEGTINKRPKYSKKSITIGQSLTANPDKVDRIRRVLQESGEKFCEHKVQDHYGVMMYFELYGHVRDYLLETAPNKVIPLEFLWSLTKPQLELFVEVSVIADGCKSSLLRKDCFSITQAKFDNIEMFRIACLLAGHANSLEDKHFTVNSSSVGWIYPKNDTTKRECELYTGKLWCLRVPSGAFFVRRDKKIYVTGNSVDSTSWSVGGGYGSILVPRYDAGTPDYSKPPLTLRISARKQDQSRGFDGLSAAQQEQVRKAAEDVGVPMSELRNTFTGRWKFNVRYHLGMAATCKGNLFKNRLRGLFDKSFIEGVGYDPEPMRMYFATVLHTKHHNVFLNEQGIRNRLLSYAFLKDMDDDFLGKYLADGLPPETKGRPRKTTLKVLSSEAYRVKRAQNTLARVARTPSEV